MKRYLKLSSVIVLCSIFILSFTSCSDDDDYSLDKYWESIVTVNKIGDNTYDFTLDNGEKLWVAAPAGLSLKPDYKRAIINYTILSDETGEYAHWIRLNAFYDVLTKKPIYIAEDDEAKQDSIGNDPVKIHSIWEGGGYLNIHFGYNAGGRNAHMLNLISADPELSAGDEVVKLEFRHNQKNDPQDYSRRGYVSFDLEPYRIEGRDKVIFEISVKEFSGETKVYTIEYKYELEDQQEEG
ncbi:MAG: NigD-like protein [Dysgonomonas sp.]|nr:NigD-like protein [Dysgonomonas sp.]